jgi:peptidoglycan/xylan/chitin deacetylase (PgdA/CDA1 family)
MNYLFSKLKKGFKKNLREYNALKKNLYPQFVFDSNLKTIKDEIPVFTLHSVNPTKFEEQLKYLVENNYKTLNSDELYQSLLGIIPNKEKTIVLTFDDGWKNLYTVVYPLLKKYNLNAVCFLITDLMPDVDHKNNNIKTSGENFVYPDSKILCNWEEIKEMHKSGIIDFQSHSKNHYLISTSSKIIDFVYPNFDTYALNIDIPLFRYKEIDNYNRNVALGTPIYENDSRFSGKKRYLDDEKLRSLCINYVYKNGNADFFSQLNWRNKLNKVVENYSLKNRNNGFYENENELKEAIYVEMRESKLKIENILGKSVNHFCYPWWVGSETALEISKEAGYLTNFWGTMLGKRTNKKGDDPFKIVRLLSDDFIYCLPGKGRKSLIKVIKDKLFFELKIKNAKNSSI